MQELRLVALNEAGTHLVLRSADGTSYLLPHDERLAAAVRHDRARLGQLQIGMESQLRPREIQARVRAGESAEEVARAAGVAIARIERYASPVLAERQHIAGAAQRTAVRRRSDGPDAPLGELVTERLAARGVDVDTLEWDAWRREDGRWAVQVGYDAAGGMTKSARWVYDPSVRVVTPDDDEARWLVDDKPAPPPEPARPAVPRLVSIARADRALGSEPQPAQPVAEPTHDVHIRPPEPPPSREREADPYPTPAAARAAGPVRANRPQPRPAARPRDEWLTGTPDRQATADGVKRRATVPSWDEIVFGSRRRNE